MPRKKKKQAGNNGSARRENNPPAGIAPSYEVREQKTRTYANEPQPQPAGENEHILDRVNPEALRMIQAGNRVLIDTFPEEAEVFEVRKSNTFITLGVIFTSSQKAQRFVFPVDEFSKRVRLLPSLWERFIEESLRLPDPFLLFVDALRMRLAYTFDPHYAISVTQVDLLPHQVDAVYRHILPLSHIRFLLADDPGLGKTIMAGLVMKELKARGLLKRVLLIVPAHLQDQWQREMMDWFREDFVILHRQLLKSLYAADFFERNPQVLVSMDFAREEEVREILAHQNWDLVIVDEAHKLSATRYGQKIAKTKRYQLGEAIAPKTTHLLLLTATPHKGDDWGYFLLLSLLEPHLFANPEPLKEAARSGGLPFVLRRAKEQVTDLNGKPLFRRREVKTLGIKLTDAEKAVYDAVTRYVRNWYSTVSGKTDRKSRNVALALTMLQRRLSSSLFAIRESLRRRKSKLQTLLREWERRKEEELPEWDEETIQDLAEMTSQDWESFQERLEGITAAQTPEELRQELAELDELIRLALEAEKTGEEAKVQELRQVVEEHLRHHPDEKLLVFTEFKDTLTTLERRIQESGFPCAVIHGQMNLPVRRDQERLFRDQVQVMVGTDAAGEGINLQFCRLMVNYDLPWNPNRLEQRMGRIHRYGQKRDCFVFNLLYPETREGKVLERLMEKLELMRQRFGDTVYDVIGTLLEGIRLEDLIMNAVLKGDTTPELEQVLEVDIEQRLSEFQRVLQENALASHHIDLSAVQKSDADSLRWRLVPWDVERFTRLAVQTVGGQMTEDRRQTKVFRISVPKEFLKQHGLQKDESFARGLRLSFEREIARKADAEFFAPGHPLLEALIDHCLNKNRPVKAVLVDEKGRDGTIWLYRVGIQDGQERPALERLTALFYDRQTGEVREVDPRMLWELQPLPENAPLPDDLPASLQAAHEKTRTFLLDRLQSFLAEAKERRERECAIKERWLKMSFEALIREAQEKLFKYHRRADEGKDMRLAIQQEEENLKALIREQKERLDQLEKERQLTLLEPQLEAIALIIPKTLVAEVSVEDEEVKRKVEEVGMQVAMEYEREHGRHPVDVSRNFLGYDIVSSSEMETRYIEVKAFATTGTLELTPHEWQMAQRFQDACWLYIVENALSNPKLHTIQNPTKSLSAQPIVGIVKIVVDGWREHQR